MKKITQSATTGGAPIYLDDFKDVFNDEIWDVLQAMVSVYDTDTQGVIIQGCNIGGSGPSSYSISGGIVYIDGEFRRFTAATGLSLPQYIKAATDVNTTRTFEDTIEKTLFVTKSADLATSVPGSGQYIAITTTTDPDDRRLALLSQTRSVDTSTGLQGGGDLSTDRTLSITDEVFRGNVIDSDSGDNDDLENIGTIQVISGSSTNAPTAVSGDIFIILSIPDALIGVTTHRYQIAIQVAQATTGLGSIYRRVRTNIGAWGAWALINNP